MLSLAEVTVRIYCTKAADLPLGKPSNTRVFEIQDLPAEYLKFCLESSVSATDLEIVSENNSIMVARQSGAVLPSVFASHVFEG